MSWSASSHGNKKPFPTEVGIYHWQECYDWLPSWKTVFQAGSINQGQAPCINLVLVCVSVYVHELEALFYLPFFWGASCLLWWLTVRFLLCYIKQTIAARSSLDEDVNVPWRVHCYGEKRGFTPGEETQKEGKFSLRLSLHFVFYSKIELHEHWARGCRTGFFGRLSGIRGP